MLGSLLTEDQFRKQTQPLQLRLRYITASERIYPPPSQRQVQPRRFCAELC